MLVFPIRGIDPEQWERVTALAESQNLSTQQWVKMAINHELKQKGVQQIHWKKGRHNPKAQADKKGAR